MKPGDEGWLVNLRNLRMKHLIGAPCRFVRRVPKGSQYRAHSMDCPGHTELCTARSDLLEVTDVPGAPPSVFVYPNSFKPKRPPSSGEHTTGEQSILDLFKRLPATVP